MSASQTARRGRCPLVALATFALVAGCVERSAPPSIADASIAAPSAGVPAPQGASPPTPPDVPVDASPRASTPDSSARFSCGNSTCAASEYCVEMVIPSGIAPLPGQSGIVSRREACQPGLPASSNGVLCAAPVHRRVQCTAMIPRAPPPPGAAPRAP